jgi:hypothetical protein
MGALLTTASMMMCPHGGTITAISSNTQATAGGSPLVRASDTFIIAGCPFTLPAAVPSPCMTVQWMQTNTESKAAGDFTLGMNSMGMCLAATQAPQGTVLINSTQQKVSGQ